MSRFLRFFRVFAVSFVCAFSAFSANAYTITLVDTNAKFPSSTYTYGGYVSMTSFESGSLQNFIAPYRPGYGYAGHWTGSNCTGTRKIDPTDGTGGGAYVVGPFTQPQTLYVCWKSILLSTGTDYSTGVTWTPRAVLLLDLNGGHGTVADEGKYWRNGGGMTYWRYDFNGWAPDLNGNCYMSNVGGVPAFFSNQGDWLLLATANNETKWMRVHNIGWGSGLYPCYFDLGVFGSAGYLPVRENYVFDGYNASASGTGFQVMAADQEYSPWKLKGASAVMSGMPSSFGQGTFNTVYAKWTPAVYRVILSGAGVSPSYVYLRYGEGWYDTQEHAQAGGNTGKVTSLTTKPVNGDFIFKGYYVGQNGIGTQIVNEDKTFRTDTAALTAITQNYTTIYPYWENPPAVWYTLTLNDNGANTLSNPRVLYYSSSCTTSGYRLGPDCSYSVVNRINIPRKTGHYYGGHYYNGYTYVNSNGTFNSQTMNLTGNVTATASWTAQSFDVAYASGWNQQLGGSAPTNPLQCVYGYSCIAPGPGWTAPLRYNFAGWSCVVNGGGYMRDGNQGTNSGNNTATAPCAQSVYHTDDSLSDATNIDTITGITGITLTAIWVPDNAVYHQFTLDANGGGGRSGSYQGVFYSVENVGWFYNTGMAYQINTNPPNIFTPIAQGGAGLSAPTPPSSNLFFAGYWTERDGGTQVVDYAGNILVPTTQYTTDKTLYAHYVAPVSVQLNTNCSYDDGCYVTNGWSCSACEVTSINAVPGRPLPSIRCAPTKGESFFVGYSTSREPGEGEMYYFSDGVTVFTNPSVTTWPPEDGPTELYAVWSRVQYGVNYWCDAGATQFGDKSAATFKCPLYTVLIGGTPQLCQGTSASSSQTGQKFSHWYLQGDTGHTFSSAEQVAWEYQVEKNLIAAYNPIYRVVLNHNGADNNPLPSEAYFSGGNWYSDASAASPLETMNTPPTKTGYSLDGYKLNGTSLFVVNGGGAFQTSNAITSAINANNLTATAQWSEKAYVAALDSQSNGAPGTTNGTEKIFYKITVGWVANALSNVEIFTITRPTQPGKIFRGYYTDQGLQVIDGIGTIVVTGNDALQLFSSSDDIVLEASWDDVPTAPTNPDGYFAVTTTPMAAGTEFRFMLAVAGDFYVQWDSDDASTVEHIVRSGTNSQVYSHTYTSAAPNGKTIKIWAPQNGGATMYNISCYSTISFGANGTTPELVAGISGSLGAVFPTINGGVDYADIPSFNQTFSGCSNLVANIGNLGNLFSGVTGTRPIMFMGLFDGCSGVTGAIPAGFFSGISGPVKEGCGFGMFETTFRNTGVTSIPAGLFSGLSGIGTLLFDETFKGTGITSIPNGLFSTITTTGSTGSTYATFGGTFENTALTELPENLFGTIVVNEEHQSTFALMFAGNSALGGYVPKTLFAPIIDNTNAVSPNVIMALIFSNDPNLATSCDPYNLTQYITGFEQYWQGHVSCAPAATFSCFNNWIAFPGGTGTPNPSVIWFDDITNYTHLPSHENCVAPEHYTKGGTEVWGCTGNTNCAGLGIGANGLTPFPNWIHDATESVHFYMGYTPDVYTVTLKQNHSSTDNGNVSGSPIKEKYGVMWMDSNSIMLSPEKAPVPSSWTSGGITYNFTGYFTERTDGTRMTDQEGNFVNAAATHTVGADATWYAQWSAVTGPFTATFKCTPTGNAVHTITNMYVGQSSANITMPAWNTYCGNVGSADTFKGWKIVQNGEIVQPGSYTWTLYSDSDVVAQWETTITLNAHTDFNNDGSNDPWNSGSGTEYIYTRYGDGVYRKKENGVLSEKMLTGENPIIAPGKSVLVLFDPANVNAALTVNGSTYQNLGTYQSAAALRAAHPTAQSGNYAIVQPTGGTAKYWVWSSSGITHEWYEWDWPVNPLYSVHVQLPFQGFYSAASNGEGPYIRSTNPNYITSSGMQTGTAYTSNQTWHAHWDSVNLSNSHFLSQNNVSFDDLAPTRPGYIFAGWYDAQSGGHQIINEGGQIVKVMSADNHVAISMTENITLYAHWTQCGATAGTGAHASVTGTTSSSDQCIYAITCDVCPDSSNAQECYSRLGGFNTEYTFNIATSQTSGVLEDAVCSARSYEINYENLQGATPSATGMPLQYTYGLGETVNGSPVSNTQIFDSWCWNLAGTDHCQASQTISTSAHGEKTYYAKWRDECLPGYERYNYTRVMQQQFNGSGQVVTKTYQPMSCSPGQYTVTCDANCDGDTCVACIEQLWQIDNTPVHLGQRYSVYQEGLSNSLWTNWESLGGLVAVLPDWRDYEIDDCTHTGTDDEYWCSTVTVFDNDYGQISLYSDAQNDPFNRLQSTVFNQNSYVAYINALAQSHGVTPWRAHYTFDGLWTQRNGGQRYLPNTNGTTPWYGVNTATETLSKFFTSDATVYAHWIPNVYEITLDRQGGSNGLTKIYEKYSVGWSTSQTGEFVSASNFVMGASQKPTLTGYNFKGYYTSASCGGTKIIDADGTMVTNASNGSGGTVANAKYFGSDSTLYACWSPKDFEITLDNVHATTNGTAKIYSRVMDGVYRKKQNGVLSEQMTPDPNGQNPITNPQRQYTVSFSLNYTGAPSAHPANQTSTYVFDGYYVNQDQYIVGSTGKVTQAGVDAAKLYLTDHTWNARWSTNSGSVVTLPGVYGSDSTYWGRDGYIFTGWYRGNELVGVKDDTYTPTATEELKAHWEECNYTAGANSSIEYDSTTDNNQCVYTVTCDNNYWGPGNVSEFTAYGTANVATGTLTGCNTSGEHHIFYHPHGGTNVLPEGYTPVEYITFNGTQYIDTGVNIKKNYDILTKFKPTVSSKYLYAARNSGDTASVSAYIGANWRWGNQAKSVAAGLNTVHTTIHNVNGITDNGTLNGYTTPSGDFETAFTLAIGANHNSNTGYSSSDRFSGNIYWLVILDENGNSVRHFVPVKDSSNVAGFYDLVTKVFVPQTAGDAFGVGDEIETPYPSTYMYNEGTTVYGWPKRVHSVYGEHSVFEGWCRNYNQSSHEYGDCSFPHVIDATETSDVDLYAKWSCEPGYSLSGYGDGQTCVANTIQITYANGGHGTPATQLDSCTYGQTFDLKPALVATDGYVFDKWSVAGNLFNASQGIMCNEANLGVTSGSVTITATWNPQQYDITYNYVGGARSLLPTGYTQLEYIQSDGTQSIDTGYILTSDNVVYRWVAKDLDASGSTSLFGSEASSNPKYAGILYGNKTNRTGWVGSSGSLALGYASNDNNFHSWVMNIQSTGTVSLSKDGTVLQTKSWTTPIQKSKSIGIFYNNGAGQKSKIALKAFSITDNGVLVRNFVPAKNSSNVAGLYDTVTGTFFTTPSGNAFTPGDPVTNAYAYPAHYTHDAGAVVYGVPTRANSVFRGWCRTYNASSNEYTGCAMPHEIKPSEHANVPLYAKWSCKPGYQLSGTGNGQQCTAITYNMNYTCSDGGEDGGFTYSGTAPNSQTAHYLEPAPLGTNVNLPGIGNCQKVSRAGTTEECSDCFDFLGWKVGAEAAALAPQLPDPHEAGDTIPTWGKTGNTAWCKIAGVNNDWGSTTNGTCGSFTDGNPFTLRPVYEPKTYTISYMYATGTNNGGARPNSHQYLATTQISGDGLPELEHGSFDGWCKDDPTLQNNCTGPETSVGPYDYGDHMFYARWSCADGYELSYNANNEPVCSQQVYDIIYHDNGGTHSLLPDGYTQLEYIQSDGNVVLDTLYTVQEDDVLELHYKMMPEHLSKTGDKMLLRANNLWTENYNTNNQWYTRFGSSASVNGAFNSATQSEGVLISKKNALIVNGTQILSPAFNAALGGTLKIFGNLSSGVPASTAIIQSKGFSITRNGRVIMRLVPAQHGNDIGMYDVVSGNFFTKTGSGNFIAGEPVTGQNNVYPEHYTYGVGTTVYGVPTRANSIFAAWCRNEALTEGCATPHEIDASEHADVDLWAKWACVDGYTWENNSCVPNTITIVYANGGHGGQPPAQQTCTYNQNPDPQLEDAMGEIGWSFVGWNLAGSTYAANASVPCDFDHLGVYSGSVTATAVWSAQEYTVTYDCGDPNWGTPPAPQNAATGQPFPVAMHGNCDKVGYAFDDWLVSGTTDHYDEGDTIESWNYTGNKTFVAQWGDFSPTFTVTTVSTMPANTAISFKIAAKGTFVVNCGADGTLTSSAGDILADGMTISRPTTTTQRTYTCTYSTGGTKTIGFAGRATEYHNTTASASAITFFMGTENGSNKITAEGSEKYIASVWGSLGSIFPTIGTTGGSLATQPRFYQTFANAHEMSQTMQSLVDNGLFSGITGIPVSYMFYSTFNGCKKLTGAIPANMFSVVSGPVKTALFRATFKDCIGLNSSIPAGLFNTITSGTENHMFYNTFNGCTGLTGGIPDGLFSGISGAPKDYMFTYTFANCTGLNGTIGSGLFSGISGAPALSMYYGTFYGDTNLTGSIPPALFGNISGAPKSSMFYVTFYNCKNLTGSIPEDLFKGNGTGISGAYQSSIFGNTFYNCQKLSGSIPSGLFGTLSGAPAESMFSGTFCKCSQLGGQIPENLFGNISGAPAKGMFYSTFQQTNITGPIPTKLFKGNGTGISGSPKENMFRATFYSCPNLGGEIPSGLFGNLTGSPAPTMFQYTFYGCPNLTGTIPSGLFGNLSGDGVTGMFNQTFRGDTNLTGYVPADLFGSMTVPSTEPDNMMTQVFAYTGLLTECPCGTTEVSSVFKPYWISTSSASSDKKVSCEVDTTSGAFYWYNGQCTTKCAEEAIDELHAGASVVYPVLKEPLAAPSINVKYGNTICYVPVEAGNGGANTLNMSYGNTVYHAVQASTTPPEGFGQR